MRATHAPRLWKHASCITVTVCSKFGREAVALRDGGSCKHTTDDDSTLLRGDYIWEGCALASKRFGVNFLQVGRGHAGLLLDFAGAAGSEDVVPGCLIEFVTGCLRRVRSLEKRLYGLVFISNGEPGDMVGRVCVCRDREDGQ